LYAGATRSTSSESVMRTIPRSVPAVIRPAREAIENTRFSGRPRLSPITCILPSAGLTFATPRSVAAQIDLP
jgi:hypothetical protein